VKHPALLGRLAGRAKLPPEHADATKVSDLMKTESGRQFWAKHGVGFEASFDLGKGSQSRQIWAAYLRKKNAVGSNAPKNLKDALHEKAATPERPDAEDGARRSGPVDADFTPEDLRLIDEVWAELYPESKSKFNASHDPHSGRFSSASGGHGGASDGDHAVAEQPKSERALRAQRSYRACNAAEQRYSVAQEKVFASAIGGTHMADNQPIDVTAPRASTKGLHGFEVKTLVNQKNDKITMKREAIDAKVAWSRANKGVLHTVVLDHRDRFDGGANASLHSGGEVYYSRGIGALRLSSMHKCQGMDELKSLIDLPRGKLPKAARGPLRES
jgi:hypothetical protein